MSFNMREVDWSRPIDWKVCLGATQVTKDIYLQTENDPPTLRVIPIAPKRQTVWEKVRDTISKTKPSE